MATQFDRLQRVKYKEYLAYGQHRQTAYWRASYSGDPWTGTETVGGVSSFYALTSESSAPAVGTAVNGYTPADFDGTTQFLYGPSLQALVEQGKTSWSFGVLFYADTASSDPGSGLRYTAPALFSDQLNGYFVLAYTASGVTAEITSLDEPSSSTLTVAAATGGWHYAQLSWDGERLRLAIDDGAASTETYSPIATTDTPTLVGTNYNTTQLFDGKILEIVAYDYELTPAEWQAWRDAANTRYALGSSPSNGTLSSTLGTATLSSAGTAPVVGSSSSTLGTATLTSAGTAPAVGSSSSTLGAATLTSAGTAPVVGSSSSTLGAVTLSSAGTAPVVGALDVTLGACVASSGVRTNAAHPVHVRAQAHVSVSVSPRYISVISPRATVTTTSHESTEQLGAWVRRRSSRGVGAAALTALLSRQSLPLGTGRNDPR